MTWERFVDELKTWLERRGLLLHEARWVVGVSGGADSTVLLRAMTALNQRDKLGWSIHAAHLNHGLRGEEADADADFVVRLAEELSAAVHTERIDLAAHVAEHGGSIEEIARRRRYDFLERIALQTGSSCIAVAHHADDNAETILHRICRGTGLRGLRGIPAVRPVQPDSNVQLVRPLLDQRRAVIEQLCEANNWETRLDASNLTGEFTRGRIRNSILPALREAINPNVSEALLRLAEQAGWLGTYLEDAAARTFDSLVVSETPREVVLNTHAFLSKQRIIQTEVIRRAISAVLDRDQDLGFSHVEMVLALAADRASGKELHLPGPVLVRKSYDRLVFRPLEEAEPQPSLPVTPVVVNCPGRTPLPSLRAELIAELCEFEAGQIEDLRKRAHPNEEWLDYDRLRPPLVVRPRREGDRFRPLGAPGEKKVSEFFIDEKVDPHIRLRAGILCDQQGPVWVMPFRISERVKLRSTTRRVLRLRLQPAGWRQADQS